MPVGSPLSGAWDEQISRSLGCTSSGTSTDVTTVPRLFCRDVQLRRDASGQQSGLEPDRHHVRRPIAEPAEPVQVVVVVVKQSRHLTRYLFFVF